MRHLLALLMYCGICQGAVPAPSCQDLPPLALRVQFQGEAPLDALLLSHGAGLQLIDAHSRLRLWSEGPLSSDTQQLVALESSLGTSLTAIDTNSDGLHDRIYAADRRGRIWRLDLLTGSAPSMWMQATLLADLGVPGGGRGFVAAPDVTRVSNGSTSWLQIAIGTASTGAGHHDHYLYVLRDELTGPAPGPAQVVTRMSLGTAQALTPSLTLDGMTWLVAVEQAPNVLHTCPGEQLPSVAARLSISALRTSEAATTHAPSNILRQPLPGSLPATSSVELDIHIDASGRRACMVGAQLIPECFLDTTPRRSWWRRDDAD